VIFNLLLNAMDALDGCETKRIWCEIALQEKEICVYMEDSGPGIAEEVRGRMFEPFVSSKKNGTGLGLAVSYGIVEAHGGQLCLIPARHENGACFEIRFPLP